MQSQMVYMTCILYLFVVFRVMKQTLLMKMGQQTLQDVQTEDLQTAQSSWMVWSAIMEAL